MFTAGEDCQDEEEDSNSEDSNNDWDPIDCHSKLLFTICYFSPISFIRVNTTVPVMRLVKGQRKESEI